MKDWKKYKLKDFMLFNPFEKIAKGEIARNFVSYKQDYEAYREVYLYYLEEENKTINNLNQ